MPDTITRQVAALENENRALRARIGELEQIRSAALKYLFCDEGKAATAGDELRARLLGEVR